MGGGGDALHFTHIDPDMHMGLDDGPDTDGGGDPDADNEGVELDILDAQDPQ